MKITLRIWLVLFAVFSLWSCNKDERSSSGSVDKDNMYRDWAQKGKRTPAPLPGRVFNKD